MPTRPAYFRPAHRPTVTDDRPSSFRRGYDRHWQRLRKTHLQQQPLCFACGDIAAVVDHITPIVVDRSRRLDPSNLRSCCFNCHQRITANFKATGVNELPPGQMKVRAA